PGAPDNYYYEKYQSDTRLYLQSLGYRFEDISQFNFTAKNQINVDLFVHMGGNDFVTLYGRSLYSVDVVVNVYESFNDYDFDWLGKWHDIIDRRDNLSFEWVTRSAGDVV
ncbi:MAG: hypothetical protein ACK6EB_37360, partial [Planctomyces sp.]